MANRKYTGSEKGEMLIFPKSPENLWDYNAFISLTCYDYDWRLYGSSLRLFFKEESQKLAEKDMLSSPNKHIFLPIPNGGLGVQDSLQYDEVKGGVTLDTKAVTIMAESVKKAGVLGQIATAYQDSAETLFGRTLNQFLVHTFKGISLRQYTYTWSFIPYSQEDANELNKIIKALRKAALPEYEPNNYTIKYPDFWVVRPYANANMLFELNYLVVSDVKVDYGSEGQVTFFKDGNPTQTTLSITFKEVHPQGSEMYGNGSGSTYDGETLI